MSSLSSAAEGWKKRLQKETMGVAESFGICSTAMGLIKQSYRTFGVLCNEYRKLAEGAIKVAEGQGRGPENFTTIAIGSELFESVAPKFFGLQLLVLRAFKCAGQRSASSALYSDILRLLSSLPLCKAGIGAASSFEQNNNAVMWEFRARHTVAGLDPLRSRVNDLNISQLRSLASAADAVKDSYDHKIGGGAYVPQSALIDKLGIHKLAAIHIIEKKLRATTLNVIKLKHRTFGLLCDEQRNVSNTVIQTAEKSGMKPKKVITYILGR
ncbi:hypothetical protein FOZ62_021772 [Perkinsus olseni]|uniref:Uncharacterized protein n=1 Tax=Perkinsus olseni TaxID=32597 RepID=A0A7J6Q8K4_PEROL|nr:hypothetical protein FOZ62_021772 [Perkinsus olseni]